MAASKTDYLENAFLDHMRGGTALSQPAGLYLALFSTAPTEASGGTELTGNGYARQAITFGAASAGAITNTATVTFTASGGAWSAIVGHAIYDASTVGNMLWFEDSVSGPTLGDGDSYEFATSAITVTET